MSKKEKPLDFYVDKTKELPEWVLWITQPSLDAKPVIHDYNGFVDEMEGEDGKG